MRLVKLIDSLAIRKAGSDNERMSQPWRDRVESALAPCRGEGLVVAVSGGGDSVALLRLAHAVRERLDLRISVAHLNHGTRGIASSDDAASVERLAASLGLPFDLGHWRPERANHFEADARSARYAWLTSVARERGASHVAVGHTRDDQAETILFRILRGTGPRGLSGIPSRRRLADGVTLIRPLLDVSRDDLRAHLEAIGQPFREDASNADLARTRNRIRNDLLPKLAAEYNPQVAETLVRLGALARDDLTRRLKRVERALREALIAAGPTAITLRREPLETLSPAMRAEVFRAAWRKAGWREAAMTANRWLRLATPPEGWAGRYSVARGIDAIVSPEAVRLFTLSPDALASPEIHAERLLVPGEIASRKITATLEPNAPHDEALDLDRVAFWTEGEARFLLVNAPEDGDRFDPLGMGGHTQSVNAFLRGRGVARTDRDRETVVRDRNGIIWVVGHRIAERVRVTAATGRRLFLYAGDGNPGSTGGKRRTTEGGIPLLSLSPSPLPLLLFLILGVTQLMVLAH